MANHSKPQYLNADGSFTRDRPGLPKRYDSSARSLAKKMSQGQPRKVDPETAKTIAETLRKMLNS